jgi:hypothetical protein
VTATGETANLLSLLEFVESPDGTLRYHRITCRRCMTLDAYEGHEVTAEMAARSLPASCCKPSERLLAPYLTEEV